MKYIKPKSVSWWASLAPLVGGLIIAGSEAVPALEPPARVVNSLSGGMTPALLVNMGLVGIGLRGAMK
jgi:hypothetical protein